MVHPLDSYPMDAWALICIASTHSVDVIRKKIHKAQHENRLQTREYYQQRTLRICVSILTCFLHVLEAGNPSMSSLHPLQWSDDEQTWRVSPLMSPFSPSFTDDLIDV